MSNLKYFYKINSAEKTDENNFDVKISLNPKHEIFSGHFPGNPVTPGVCMMQIVKDLTEKISEKKLFLSSASNVKFMAIINPEENPDLLLKLELSEDEQFIKVKNVTSFGETIALKMNANYKIL